MKHTILKFSASLLATCILSSTASAQDQDWMVRVRALGVLPDVSSSTNIGGHVDVNNSLVPELDISYFFTKNIASELILATTKHDLTAKGTTLGDVNVGSAWLLPPTLTLQYHFTQWENIAKPYVGAGLNYTFFYDTSPGALNSVSYKNNLGYALQAGVDIPVKNNWYVNFDVKKVFLSTTATFNGGAVRADVDLDPWLIGAGVGYRF